MRDFVYMCLSNCTLEETVALYKAYLYRPYVLIPLLIVSQSPLNPRAISPSMRRTASSLGHLTLCTRYRRSLIDYLTVPRLTLPLRYLFSSLSACMLFLYYSVTRLIAFFLSCSLLTQTWHNIFSLNL